MKKYINVTIYVTLAFIALSAFTSKTNVGNSWYTKTGTISFFSKTKVEDIEAKSNQATVVFNDATGEFNAKVFIKSFLFKKKLMQEHFNENYMESNTYPEAVFIGKITNISKIDFSKDSTYNVACAGKLTMHGVTKEFGTTGTLKTKANTQATINTTFSVLLKDYNIEKPKAVTVKIADKIDISISSDCKKYTK